MSVLLKRPTLRSDVWNEDEVDRSDDLTCRGFSQGRVHEVTSRRPVPYVLLR